MSNGIPKCSQNAPLMPGLWHLLFMGKDASAPPLQRLNVFGAEHWDFSSLLMLFSSHYFITLILAGMMDEGEGGDDLQTLIRPDDLEGITEEHATGGQNPSSSLLQQQQLPAWRLPLYCIVLVLLTTTLLILLPPYLEVSWVYVICTDVSIIHN